jgi:tetratricopeptide (TPR) repeat protein
MERLRGDDLETRLAGGPLPVDRAVVFLRQTAGAIGAAHERGIVHRDLKPANLFVVADPDVVGGERVKVLDFGIAKLTVDSGAGKTQGVFGTPAYMSPEQCASTGAVDARADLYSLGCIFYELVCGGPPFGHGGLELIAAHLRDTPMPPRAIAPWLPPAIEQVILRLLEKQPDRRFPSCAALAAALDEAAASSGLPAASVPHLPAGGGLTASAPQLPPAGLWTGGAPSPSTLGSGAGAVSMLPARKRGLGPWLGVGAVVVVGAVVAVMAIRGGPSLNAPPPPAGPTGPSDAAVVIAVPADAASVAVASADAAPVDRGSATQEPPKPESSASQAEIAAKLNEEGKAEMYASRFDNAAKKFQEAVAHVPEPKYSFNLGTALFQLGRFDEAQTALRALRTLSPSEQLALKAKKLLEKIDQERKAQGLPPGSPEPAPISKPDPTKATPPAQAPTAEEIAAQAAKHNEAGKAALYAGRYDEARTLFERAYSLEPKPQILLNLCLAEFQSGRCTDARRTCQRVTATWPGDPAAEKAQKLFERMGACK